MVAGAETDPPVGCIYAGQGSAVWRTAPTKWSSRFVPGRDGEQRECAQRFVQWMSEPARAGLRAEAAELLANPIACECPLWVPCHVDVIVALALVPSCSPQALLSMCWRWQPIPGRVPVPMPQEAFCGGSQVALPG